MLTTHFKIAEAARMVGISASTLRLWETQDLIEPIRTPSGQRLYDLALVDRLKRIAWLRQEQGLNPAGIRELLKGEMASEATAAPVAEAPADERRAVPEEMPVGQKVRRLRRAAGKTLDAVARATGVAPSVLSTFERTSQGLSLTGLHAVAHYFETTVSILCGEDTQPRHESLVRQGAWPTWPATSSGVTVQVLAEGTKQMQCHRFQLAPGASSEGAYQHEGEEFLHVLTGALEIVLDGDRFFELNAGDSFSFESNRPHSWRNLSDGETVIVWINTPASF